MLKNGIAQIGYENKTGFKPHITVVVDPNTKTRVIRVYQCTTI